MQNWQILLGFFKIIWSSQNGHLWAMHSPYYFLHKGKQTVDVHKKLMKTLLSQSLCGWPAPWDLGGQIKGNPWFGKQRNPQGQQIPLIRAEAGGVSEDRGPVTAPFPPHCPCFSWLSGWKWTIDLLDLWTAGYGGYIEHQTRGSTHQLFIQNSAGMERASYIVCDDLLAVCVCHFPSKFAKQFISTSFQ